MSLGLGFFLCYVNLKDLRLIKGCLVIKYGFYDYFGEMR